GLVTGTTVEGNLVSGSGRDGVHVLSVATTVSGNTALRNHALGIDAVAGVTDGGGNRAADNGDPAQCVNVSRSTPQRRGRRPGRRPSPPERRVPHGGPAPDSSAAPPGAAMSRTAARPNWLPKRHSGKTLPRPRVRTAFRTTRRRRNR